MIYDQCSRAGSLELCYSVDTKCPQGCFLCFFQFFNHGDLLSFLIIQGLRFLNSQKQRLALFITKLPSLPDKPVLEMLF